MGKEIKFREIAPLDCSKSMVIVSFPTPGLVGSLAASYIVRSLKLERVGTFSSDDFVPTAVIYDRVPSPPANITACIRILQTVFYLAVPEIYYMARFRFIKDKEIFLDHTLKNF